MGNYPKEEHSICHYSTKVGKGSSSVDEKEREHFRKSA